MLSARARTVHREALQIVLFLAVTAFCAATAVRIDRARAVSLANRLQLKQADGPVLRAVLLLQAADCESSLRFVEWLQARIPSEQLQLARIIHLGPRAEFERVRAWAEATMALPVQQTDSGLEHVLTGFGQRETPWLVILDQTGAVRLSLATPTSPRGRQAMLQALRAIALDSVATGDRRP